MQGTKDAAGRAFSSRMVELALSGYPGLYALGPPQPGSAFGVYWPACSTRRCSTTPSTTITATETIARGNPTQRERRRAPPAEPPATPSAQDSWSRRARRRLTR